ncbi:MAG: phosphate signaling complex protein PhoU [Gammaproteobacteria bacterium]|nr:phosphate signaling complex protein PhoU [Gammaproteobacteria bacterium]
MPDFGNFNSHISHQFNEEIEAIRTEILQMGGMVEQQIRSGMQALLERDSALGEQVAKGDQPINALHKQIDEECMRILAKRQPTASDLRLVISVMRTVTDIERAGDEAAKIGKIAQQLAVDGEWPQVIEELEEVGEQVRQAFSAALDAFARMDSEEAFNIAIGDKQIDHLYKLVLKSMLEMQVEDKSDLERFLKMTTAARSLERIGDHAKNVCEGVVFLVKGRDIRHIQPEEL